VTNKQQVRINLYTELPQAAGKSVVAVPHPSCSCNHNSRRKINSLDPDSLALLLHSPPIALTVVASSFCI
jgi:hypothetical protein